ncbi:MAG TPA: hypothetical protein VGR28_03275 [Candidatus Thermoplasmatota archaeon]|jgi:hypothetical protein|nr:hypothetical protein [Candidatus Thermoplasmatota archaeon]
MEPRTPQQRADAGSTSAELRALGHPAAAIDAAPRRHPALHHAALGASLASLVLLAAWLAGSRSAVAGDWLALDVVLGVAFAAEFFTRSGFRWDRAGYTRAHVFDFVAMVPALALVGRGVPFEGVWVWLILAMRAARVVDRALGDGFVKRNALALLEGFEEEITDRVLLRILGRIEGDLGRGRFGAAVAEALARNKAPVLERVRAAHPMEGVAGELAHLAGLDAALQRAEERAYDAVVEVVASREVDAAIRDVLASSFDSMRGEIAQKAWRQRLGLRRGPERLGPRVEGARP